ncbi:MAG: GTPase ObgE [Nitrospiria bacterium]
MFIDQVKIYVKAGDGGKGCISFRREKYVPRGGPDGGDGGKGGDVVFEAGLQLSTLVDLRYQQHYTVKHAGHGSGKNATGKNSADTIIRVPVGTVVRDRDTNEILADLVEAGQRVVVAKGGKGGRGNSRFKSATQQSPRMAEPGDAGEDRWLWVELKLLADLGLVGLPNAGKSSLMASITEAHPKIANYPFTTLEPALGVVIWEGARHRMHQFTIADIPGLIEGAHEGKGLGFQFLKHLERTSILLHLLDLSGEGVNDPIHAFEIVRNEIERYHPDMHKKPFMVTGTKIDLPGALQQAVLVRPYFKKRGIPFFETSSVTGKGMDALIQCLGRAVEHFRNEERSSVF